MAKRYKLRLSRVIPSFQSCRSKDPTNLPENPLPAIFKFSPVNPKAIDIEFPVQTPPPPPSKSKSHHSSSINRHVSSSPILRSKPARHYFTSDDNTESSDFQWKKEEKWHVVAKVKDDTPCRKIYNSSVSGESEADISHFPQPRPATEKKKKQRNQKKKSKQRMRSRFSTSSVDSGWFSNDEETETETLVSSSRTFSTDSSAELHTHSATIPESQINELRPKKKKNLKSVTLAKVKLHNSKGKGRVYTSPESESQARLSVFRRLMPCKIEGKVKESLAVVKKSENPFEDFKVSMLEMIVEKQMFDARELEQLLCCFLSLNSRYHHAVIVDAFSEIWQILFCNSPLKQFA